MLLNQVVIDVVEFPFDSVGIDHPELALISVTTIDVELLARFEARRLDAHKMVLDGRRRIHLDTEMINEAAGALSAMGGREHQIHRREEG